MLYEEHEIWRVAESVIALKQERDKSQERLLHHAKMEKMELSQSVAMYELKISFHTGTTILKVVAE